MKGSTQKRKSREDRERDEKRNSQAGKQKRGGKVEMKKSMLKSCVSAESESKELNQKKKKRKETAEAALIFSPMDH